MTVFSLLNIRSQANISTFCNDFISSKKLDFIMLTETWSSLGDYVALNEACPPGFIHVQKPRTSGRGGGLAVIYRENLKCSPYSLGHFTSFENLTYHFMINGKKSALCVLIYRSPKSCSGFIQEFSDLLTVIMPWFCIDFR